MKIFINVDVMLAKPKMSVTVERVGRTMAKLSILKNGKAKAICMALDCRPGDIIEYQNDEEETQNG
ncbi:helix-turn-helix domain-containing protein [Sutcliffiella horikoshii]|uniref:helix-turn-helix domain-containing protein n=1 Tax=Sutcliffiella horikoshii TaxID=79883 RepID=UPI00384A5547